MVRGSFIASLRTSVERIYQCLVVEYHQEKELIDRLIDSSPFLISEILDLIQSNKNRSKHNKYKPQI